MPQRSNMRHNCETLTFEDFPKPKPEIQNRNQAIEEAVECLQRISITGPVAASDVMKDLGVTLISARQRLQRAFKLGQIEKVRPVDGWIAKEFAKDHLQLPTDLVGKAVECIERLSASGPVKSSKVGKLLGITPAAARCRLSKALKAGLIAKVKRHDGWVSKDYKNDFE